ncbi:MAG: serine/threonine-protein kinase [Pirellulaceae bacterium]|nr:serine/threonine-protein kinase [Pirellulaceae bacterium]
MSDSTNRTPTVVDGAPANPESGVSELSKQRSGSSHLSPLVDRTVIAQSPIAGPGEFYPTGTVASLARVLIGMQLDHYLLHELIGGGGMGAVFRASDTRLDRVVAVKVIPNLGRDLETLRRFRIEAQSAAKLDHPNIARVYYVGETEAWSYIVFEYVEGVNLRDLVVRHGPLRIDDAVCYTCQVAEALQHASERAVVHRDIKPSNVLVTPEGFIKVVDMGLARTTALDRSTNDLTASGVTLGTFDYISPEQARDPRAADVRSDLYSLGCTLYYMLTGRPPFPEGTAMQKLLMHGSVQADDARDFRDDVSADLSAIIKKLMAKKPADRYQEPIDLVADLQCLAELESLTKSQRAVGLAASPALVDRSLFETAMPWIVGLLAIVGSTWYLHSQHIASASFDIPRIEETVSASFQTPPKTEEIQGFKGLFDNSTTIFEKPLSAEKPFEFFSTGTEQAKASSDLLKDVENLSAAKPENSVGSSNVSLPNSRIQNPKPSTLYEERAKSNARVLVVRSLESTEPMVDQGLEFREMVGDLADAFVIADSDLAIEEIWLDDDFWIVDSTLELKREMLVIRSAPNRKARIELRIPRRVVMSSNNSLSNDKLIGIHIGSNQLVLDDLDMTLVSPDSGSGSVSMLGLSQGGSVRVLNSTLSLSSQGSAWKTSGIASVFDIASANLSALQANQDPLQIELEDVVFRGEGDLLSLEVGQRTELEWRNGLLAVSGRMLEIGGSRESSRTPPTIRVDLEQVTVAARQGFARIRLTQENSYPVYLSRDSINCTYSCDHSRAVVTLENVAIEQSDDRDLAKGELSSWLSLRGRDNAYDEQIDELIRWTSPRGVVTRIGFEEASTDFFAERALETSVRWVTPHPVQKPFEQQSAGDYLQRNGSFRPGFRPELLPNH